MSNLTISDLIGTLKSTFKINKANITSAGLTALRTITVPDKSGTVAMTSDIVSIASVTEVPSGTVNGSNVTFTLTNSPANTSAVITINGVKQLKTTDYSITGSTITFTVAPFTDALLEAYYVYTVASSLLATEFAKGTATIDFGTGGNEASVVVGSQPTILSTSIVVLSVSSDSTTANHTANDHVYFPALAGLSASTPIDATGFTIYARSIHNLTGQFKINWAWN